ncbi:MAG: 50S ribosomal protein L11 methyltransferase [Bacteroidales bacterium]|nr:50S ribosomal protein L11 methyltransferase [Bacteroidales bacterium]
MKYIEVEITIDDKDTFHDLLIDQLGNEGPYESFVDTPNGLKAYVPADKYEPEYLRTVAEAFPLPLKYHVSEMEDRDWNAEWEKDYADVVVESANGRVHVRAPFHPSRHDVDYEVVISPKMSFGTAHHPTTYMMVSYVCEANMTGKTVLDMGCGTAVLAILASMRGAAKVEGIDIDSWAYENAIENARTNQANITILQGDASAIDGHFDMILANINRNILLADMSTYARCLNEGGRLVVSGFFDTDADALNTCAKELGLTPLSTKTRQHWCAIEYVMQAKHKA